MHTTSNNVQSTSNIDNDVSRTRRCAAESTSGTVQLLELGYARVSTTKQDLDRQVMALQAAGIAAERIYVDQKSGATTNRPGLQAVIAAKLAYANHLRDTGHTMAQIVAPPASPGPPATGTCRRARTTS